ncbi:MAG: hypothetical protein AAF919_17460 [Pseudomonadota bacterium]
MKGLNQGIIVHGGKLHARCSARGTSLADEAQYPSLGHLPKGRVFPDRRRQPIRREAAAQPRFNPKDAPAARVVPVRQPLERGLQLRFLLLEASDAVSYRGESVDLVHIATMTAMSEYPVKRSAPRSAIGDRSSLRQDTPRP